MEPQIRLLVDDSQTSREAERLLGQAGIEYRRFRSSGSNLPTAYYLGVSYPKLESIILLVSLFQRIREKRDRKEGRFSVPST